MNTDGLDPTRTSTGEVAHALQDRSQGTPFDPFCHRLSRDIRNQLSESIIACLRTKSLDPAREVAKRFLGQQPGPEQLAYIEKRLILFQRFLDRVGEGPQDVLWQGLVLWDLGLHFEVHEVLEHAWHRAKGEEKLLLQAMIRAAGVYIKGDYGYFGAAAKLAAKALPVLEAQQQRLAVYIDPERLLNAMRNPTSPAPTLLARGIFHSSPVQG
nr:DUF309 domain-containing protein [uncultured Desulfobulbus sp.]